MYAKSKEKYERYLGSAKSLETIDIPLMATLLIAMELGVDLEKLFIMLGAGNWLMTDVCV